MWEAPADSGGVRSSTPVIWFSAICRKWFGPEVDHGFFLGGELVNVHKSLKNLRLRLSPQSNGLVGEFTQNIWDWDVYEL